jgi:predicted AlkP superfamily phosphohydrolase/phosphomutase/tetratricopeptide (TPR) repeat protein
MPDVETRRVLLVGWDAADWSVIRPLLARGWMPNLQTLINKGAAGTLLNRAPLLGSTLWATIVTGQGALEHGVLGSRQMRKDQSSLRPIGHSARRVPAIWNLLEDAGVTSTVIGFPATYPAEQLAGVCVSDAFATSISASESAHSVWPPSFREVAESARVTPGQIDAASILTFIPKAAELAGKVDPRLDLFRQILAQTATMHAVATAALERNAWRFAAVRYAGLEHFSQVFMPFHPPKVPEVPTRDFDLYEHVVTGAYRFHDMMLGRLLELAGNKADVILVSNHGFQSGAGRTGGIAGSEMEQIGLHRREGIVVAASAVGGEVHPFQQMRAVEVAPTILAMFGVEPPIGMKGRAMDFARDRRMPLLPARPENAAIDQPADRDNIFAEEEAGDRSFTYLRSLGYLEQVDHYALLASDRLEADRRHVEALAWMEYRQVPRAVSILEEIAADYPALIDYQITLGEAYAASGNIERFSELTQRLRLAYPNSPIAVGATGIAAMMLGDKAKACELLNKAQQLAGKMAWLHAEIGRSYLRMAKWQEALTALNRAVALDDELPEAHAALAIVQARLGDKQAAIASARRAVESRPQESSYQRQLGLLLIDEHRYEDAQTALETALKLDPNSAETAEALANVREALGDLPQAQRLRSEATLMRFNRQAADRVAFDMALRIRG